MFFEDEKDFIDNKADIHISDDGTVTWEDVLSDDGDDDLVSLSKQISNSSNKEGASVDLGDDLELVRDDEDDADDSDLSQILNDDGMESTVSSDGSQSSQPLQDDEDFDIDSQLANVVSEQNNANSNAGFNPRKNEKKQSKSMMPVLLAALFAIFVAALFAGGKYFMDFMNSKNVEGNELERPLTPRDEMDNITRDKLEQRKTENDNIPVVNEDEVDEVKPEEEPVQDEKKEVIDIKPAGRENPFVPLDKYLSVSIPHATLNFENVNMPKPPEQYGEQDETTVKLLTIAVSGIMYDEDKPSAIITYDNNDYFVQKGDKLDDYRVVEIAKNYVTIALGKNTYRANIGEEFKINSNFYGSAQYLDKNQGGGRQYYSVGDGETQQSSTSKTTRYVSEDEVIINAR